MGYGLDISSSFSMLVGLTRKGATYKLKSATALPGFTVDTEERPEASAGAPVGSTFRALSNIGIKPGRPTTLLPGRDVFYRFAPCTSDDRATAAQVRLEADDIGGDGGGILADYVHGVASDYSTVAHIGLAREAVVDHYANSLRFAGVETGKLVPGCIALFNAYLVSGDQMYEGVYLFANIGDDSTDIILVREGQLLYTRTVTMGVSDFVARLAPEYGGDQDAIRQVLFREIDLRPSVASDNISGDRGVGGAQEVASRLFQQITGTIMLAKGAHKDPQLEVGRIALCGPGAAIPGLRELMMSRVRKTVDIFDPLAEIPDEGADEASRETVGSYRPALTLAVGLAKIASDASPVELHFLPASVRRRQEFLNKSLFLYLASAVALVPLLAVFMLVSAAASTSQEELDELTRGPYGTYGSVEKKLEARKKSLKRGEKRAAAPYGAIAPGFLATQMLRDFAERRPASVRVMSCELVSEQDKKARKSDAKAPYLTLLKWKFFIEQKGGSDPDEVYKQLRQILRGLKGAKDVRPDQLPKPSTGAPGKEASYIIVLDLQEAP